MATSVKIFLKEVKPILSLSPADARRRVLALYKAWYREIPTIVRRYAIPKTEHDCRVKLREEFLRHRHVTDIRVIDLMVIKGQQALQEVATLWRPKGNLMTYWGDTVNPKPTDFMSKFVAGHE